MIAQLLVALALAQHDSADLRQARMRPDETRDRIARLLERALPSRSSPALDSAIALAAAYAAVWNDSTPLGNVRDFAAAAVHVREARLRADRLRLAGNRRIARDGPEAALPLWRASVRTAASVGYTTGVAAALGNLGAGFYSLGDSDSAVVYLERSRRLAIGARDLRTAANAVGTLGSVAKDGGDLARAARLYAEAGRIRRRIGDTRGLAADENNAGLLAEQVGDLEGAAVAYGRALSLNRSFGRALPAAANLLNLGNVATLAGDYDLAASRYAQALQIYQRLGARPDEALAWQNIGQLESRRGNAANAITALNQALRLCHATGGSDASIRVSLANALVAAGRLSEARQQLTDADARAEREQQPDRRGAVAVARGDLALQFGDYAGADREYHRAATLFRDAGDPAGAAGALEGAGMLALLRRRPADARAAFENAIAAYQSSGDRRAAATTRVLLGRALDAGGDTSAARAAFEGALAELRRLQDPVGQAVALEALGAFTLAGGLPATAESLYQSGLSRLARHPYAPAAWRLDAGVAAARSARGNRSGAIDAYRRAVDRIQAGATAAGRNPERAAYLEDKWDVYAQLARAERVIDPPAAFLTSERMRGGQLRLTLAGEAERRPGPALAHRGAELLRRIDDLSSRVEGASAPAGERERIPGGAGAALTEALTAAQRGYAEYVAEYPRHPAADGAGGAAASARWDAIARSLAPDQVLLEYLVHDSTAMLFAITNGSLRTFELGISQRELAHLIDFSREMIRDTGAGGSRWQAPLARLYDVLLGPAARAGLLAGKRELVIVPHAELHYLPFAALVADRASGHFLIESFDVTYASTATAWLFRRPPAERGAALAMAPRPDALPGTAREIRELGRQLGAPVTLLLGAQATEARLRELAPAASVIHLATFGVLNRHSPLFSYVDLAAGGGRDGRLETHEIFDLKLRAALVVLSACQTSVASGAVQDVPPGDDWVGLVNAFLTAGAANVVATAWPIEDGSAATLMAGFYGALARRQTPARALAGAQRTMIDHSRTRAPRHWAAFMLTTGGSAET